MRIVFVIILMFLASCSKNIESEKDIKQKFIERVPVEIIDSQNIVNWVWDVSSITYLEDENNNRYVCEYSYWEYFCFGKWDTYFDYDWSNLFREIKIK